MAFAVAELAFGYLNSSTAFLGSIIIGNGINYAIVLMSRYEEHRARGEDPNEALRNALGGTWRANAGGGAGRVGRVRVADGHQLPRLLPVRRDGRGRRAVLLDRDLHGAAGDAGPARPAGQAARRPAARRWSSGWLARFLRRPRRR